MGIDWRTPLILITVLVISRIFPAVFDDSDVKFFLVALILMGSLTFVGYWFQSRTSQKLREGLPEWRDAFFAHLSDAALVDSLRRDLARDLETYQGGVVERFGFAPSLKREATMAYWLWASFVAVGILLSSRITLSLSWLAFGIALVAVLAFGGLLFLMRWRRYLDTWLEISQFSLSEVWADGSRRTILWNTQLRLLNQPRRHRVRVFAGNIKQGISVHYRRTCYSRAIRLVFDYGGFVPAEPGA